MAGEMREVFYQVSPTELRPGQRRIALHLGDWSPWCRAILSGVKSFAHQRPEWQLHVLTGWGEWERLYGPETHWDGILTHALHPAEPIRRLLDQGQTQIVNITPLVPNLLKDIPSVRVNEDKVASLIARHLFSGGFRHIGYATARFETLRDYQLDTLRAVVESAGFTFHHMDPNPPRDQSGVQHMMTFISGLPKPVGVVIWSMGVAGFVLHACERLKLKVPEEVAIVSWDDDPLMAECLSPTISSAVQPTERVGYEAAKRLDELLRGQGASSEPVLVEPSGVLRVRQSSDVLVLPDSEVHLAMQYIREHAARPIRVPDLLATVSVSRSKLEHDFIRVYGQTPNQTILQAHLARAKQLLLETDWPVARIAEQSGFGSKHHFHHTFVRLEGITPAAYRTQHGRMG